MSVTWDDGSTEIGDGGSSKSGTFKVTFKVPNDKAGDYPVKACVDAKPKPECATATFTIDPKPK